MDIYGIPTAEDIAKVGDTGSKIVDAIGSLFPGIKVRSIIKAEGRKTDAVIKDLEKIKAAQEDLNLDEESIAFLMGDVVRRYGEYENFNAVLSFAEPMVDESADASNVSKDWAEHFRDKAEKAYDDDIRMTWAKILAGEINNPGTFSKRTLSILSDMNKKEVEALLAFCSSPIWRLAEQGAVYSDPYFVIAKDDVPGIFNDGSLTYGMKMELESLGLIDSGSRRYVRMDPGDRQAFLVGDHIMLVECIAQTESDLSFSPILTKYGKELSNLCTLKKTDDIEMRFAKFVLDQNNFSVATLI